MLRVALPVLVIACSAAAEPAKPDAPELRVKRLVDRYRAAVGLPVVDLDAKLSKGCMEHAEYMRLNKDTDAMVGLNAHQQRPNLPGATADGAACGKAADLFPGVADLEVAVDGWMSGLYHRRPILSPALAKIGVGYSKLPNGSYMAALMFVDNDAANASKWPIAYPADKQSDLPLDFGNEVPNPIPGGGRAGYPITIQFPPFDKVTGVTAKLSNGGKDVPFYLSDPEHPATSFGQYGVVCLISKLPLSPRTTYEVRVDATWKGKPGTWSWSFSTLALRAVDAHDEKAVEKAFNVASTLRGTVIHGGMMNGDTAFLQFGERKLERYKMLSVLIPRAVWQQLGGSAAAFVGKKIEVDGTPRLDQGIYINVPITLASQLRVVK
jgi:Cysteine-rich secretory protein family